MKRRCQMITGVAAETMSRDDGWRFFVLGWMLERAEMTCRLLNVRYGELSGATDLAGFHLLVGVLKSASASEAYRKTLRRLDGSGAGRRVPAAVAHLPAQRPVLPAPGRARPCPAHGRRRAHPSRADPRAHPGRARVPRRRRAARGRPPAHLDRIQDGVRQASDAIAAQYFRNVHDRPPLDPRSPRSESEADRCGSTSATARGSTTTTWCASRRTSCGPRR